MQDINNVSGNLRKFSAPGRTELAGNHTDHNCGKVLAAAIQLENAATVYKKDDGIVFFRSGGFPDVTVNLDNLDPLPQETGTTQALVRGIAAELKKRGRLIGGFSANAVSTVLPGSGLSSSAALEMLLCRIFDSIYNEDCRPLSNVEIAQIGQIAENVYFGKPCGLMDQIACAVGGAVAIDFANIEQPQVKQIYFNPADAGYALCVVNTGGSHADLTADYAAVPLEMKQVAAFFGKTVLRELDKQTVIDASAEIRKKTGDRALLRTMHFFNENERVDAMTAALEKRDMQTYLENVNESGDSSWQLLQNIYAPHYPQEQGISAALALTKDFFKKQGLIGACRVHGGGFAGTIQVYIPIDAMKIYGNYIEKVFNTGSVTPLQIRQTGAIELDS